MRRPVDRLTGWFVLGLGAMGLVVAVGCAGSEKVEDGPTDATQRQGEDSSLADSAEAAARQLEDAMARMGGDPADDAGGRVEWVETWPRQAPQDPDDADTVSQGEVEAGPDSADADTQGEPTDAVAQTPDASAQAAEAARATPEELLEQLLAHVRTADEPAMRRALTAATFRAAVGDGSLDAYVLHTLGYSQRRAVERYHRMLLTLLGELAEGGSGFDRAALFEHLDAMFEHEPVEIRKLALCREVSGYGIYEPFERHRFLAGQRQRLVVYVELDHFRSQPLGDGRYEVRLQQQVVLYNEADGLAVWRHDPVQITDVSRNRRRDFFVVQLIALPERLNVGNYRLKVRLTDEHSGSIDETTTRIQLVADEKLLTRDDEQ